MPVGARFRAVYRALLFLLAGYGRVIDTIGD